MRPQSRSVLSAGSRCARPAAPAPLSLEALEERNLLAADVGFDFHGHDDHVPSHDHGAAVGDVDFVDPDVLGDADLRTDALGNRWYVDAAPQLGFGDVVFDEGGVAPVSLGSDGFGPQQGPLVQPALSSRPEATRKIFLDFDGHVVSGTLWNNRNGGSDIHAPAYSTDGDTSRFNGGEIARIGEIWRRVAEDFAPFDVDVTTVDPGAAAFGAGGQAIRTLISTNVDEATGNAWFGSAGGVAYINSWNWSGDTPVWVFENMLGNGHEKYTAEAASHEVGHALGLYHDGRSTPSEGYYRGHGSGETGWAPIMGVGYYKPLAQWSKGEYAGANNQEDDLAKIAAKLDYRTDDHGDGADADATALAPDADLRIAATGVVGSRGDVDAFSFVTGAGDVELSLAVFQVGDGKANLDAQLTLVDASGTVVAAANPSDSLGASIATSVAAGEYLLLVEGVGKGAVSGTGYSDYGSLGQYALTGQLVESTASNRPPVAVDDDGRLAEDSSVVLDVLANDGDPDGDALTLVAVGTPDHGAATISGGKLAYTPDADFFGTDSFTYLVGDGDLTDSGTVTVTVTPVNDDPAAATDYAGVPAGGSVLIDVLANDGDVDGDPLSLVRVGPATGGVAAVQGDRVRFTADAGFEGTAGFTYTVADGAGGTDVGDVFVTVTAPRQVAFGESGAVTFAQGGADRWYGVSFGRRFLDPVVVMGPPGYRGADPSTMRVRNVTGDGFEFQLDEWDYKDGRHTTETVGWLAVERGTHTLADGTRLVAGSASVGTGFGALDFPVGIGGAGFAATPTVLATVAGGNDAGAVTVRLRDVGRDGFQARIQEQEAADGVHAAETVGYVALAAPTSSGTGVGGGAGGGGRLPAVGYEIGRTGDRVTHADTTTQFARDFASAPVFLANMQTTDGGDAAALRHRSLSADAATYFVEEEKSRDSEIRHTTEVVGFLALDAGLLFKPADGSGGGGSGGGPVGRFAQIAPPASATVAAFVTPPADAPVAPPPTTGTPSAAAVAPATVAGVGSVEPAATPVPVGLRSVAFPRPERPANRLEPARPVDADAGSDRIADAPTTTAAVDSASRGVRLDQADAALADWDLF